MSGLRIGWFGIAPHMDEGTFEVSGSAPGIITVSGRIPHSDMDLIAVVHHQLRDLAANRAALPVQVGSVPSFDGFYTVSSVDLSAPQGTACRGWWPWAVQLQAIESRDFPLFESRIIGGLRGNTVGATAFTRWHAPPVGASRWGLRGTTPTTSTATATIEGDVMEHAGWSPPDVTASWRIKPDQWGGGAARILTGSAEADVAPGGATFGPLKAEQTYVVPAGVTRLQVSLGGSAGAIGGVSSAALQMTSSAGALVRGYLDVTPGEALKMRVGHATGNYHASNTPWWGGGVAGNTQNDAPSTAKAGNGGDYSAIYRGTTLLALAGGGGGAGGNLGFGSGYGFALKGGNSGPGSWGQNGSEVNNSLLSGGGARTGPGLARGVTGYVNTSNLATDGASLAGGKGGNATNKAAAGGGGGGGLQGGAGGSGRDGDRATVGGAGGGGSSSATGLESSTFATRTDQAILAFGGDIALADGFARLDPITDAEPPRIDRYHVCGPERTLDPFGWQITNGIITVSPAADAGRMIILTGPADQDTAIPWLLNDSATPNGAAAVTIVACDVIRADPEQVVVALDLSHTTITGKVSAATATITLRRGAYLATITIDGTAAAWGLSTPGVPVFFGSGYASVGSGPNMYTMTFTHGTRTSGAMSVTTPTSTRATFGAGIGAGAGVAPQWFAATSETVRQVRL